MLISPAFAHGSSGVDSGGQHGPLILLVVAVVVVSLLVAEKNGGGVSYGCKAPSTKLLKPVRILL